MNIAPSNSAPGASSPDGVKPVTAGSESAGDGLAEPWRSPQDPQARETREQLLNQFYSTLRVMYLASDLTREATRAVREQITQKFEEPRTWRGAYELEQLLAFVMTDDQVATELPRRMVEGKALKLPFIDELEKQFNEARGLLSAEESADDAKRERSLTAYRYILHRLLNDLQWFYNQRIRRRDAAKRLSVRVSALFLSAFLFFFGLLFVQLFSNPAKAPSDSGTPGTAERHTSPIGADKE